MWAAAIWGESMAAEKLHHGSTKTQTVRQACSRIAGCNKNAASLTGLGFPANTLKSPNAVRSVIHLSARVAKLVDAPGLGPDASNGVGVRVPSLAPTFPLFFLFARQGYADFGRNLFRAFSFSGLSIFC